MAWSNVKYYKKCSEHTNLTRIHGEPTFESLHKERNEFKANKRSVYYHLWGGSQGHIGLILTP